MAVEKGYQILHIHEVWHFPDQQEGLFANYVNTWLKIKEEASGWPSHVGEDPEKQRQYVEDYYAREHIRLQPSNIRKNPGLRALSKMMLNSMWGKFGQKPNKVQVCEFDDPVAFSAFHESNKYDIRYVSVLTENRVEIHYKHQLEDDLASPNLNIFVAQTNVDKGSRKPERTLLWKYPRHKVRLTNGFIILQNPLKLDLKNVF